MNIAPEFESVETFAQFLIDDERTTFLPGEAQKLAECLRRPMADVAAELKTYGFTVAIREKTAEVRGIHSNNHDRYSEKNGCINGTGIGNASRQMVSGWQPI